MKVVYDSYHTGHIGLVIYSNGCACYLLLANGYELGKAIYCGSMQPTLEIKQGSSFPLNYIKLFSKISNIELKPNKGAQLIRAAGASCLLIGKKRDKVILK